MNERLIYLDYIKTIALVLVLLYHCAFSQNFLLSPILSTCVPLFFCVNGFLMLRKEHTMDEMLLKNIKILFLAVFWSVISIIIVNISIHGKIPTLEEVWRKTQSPYIPDNAHIWYMYSLAALNILNPIIGKYLRNINKREAYCLILILCLFSLQITSIYWPRILNFMTWTNSFCLVYYITGYLLLSKRINLSKIKNSLLIVLILLFILIQYIHTYLAFNVQPFTRLIKHDSFIFQGFYTYPIFFLTCTIIELFSRITWKKNKFIDFISKNSLGIYLVHWSIFSFLRTINPIFQNGYILVLSTFIISITCVFLFNTNTYSSYLINMNIKLRKNK